MPFFIRRKTSKQIHKLKYQIVTLQVRIPLMKTYAKKAFLPIPASMTLEAALCLSLFIFAAVSMILPMKIMTTERRVQAGLESVGEDLSQYAYLKDILEKGKVTAIPGADEFAKGFCKNLGKGVAEGYAMAAALGHADTGNLQHAGMLRSEILEDGETLDLILDYEIRMPFPVLGLQAVPCSARSTRRAWIGKSGKDEGGGTSGEDDDDEIVYVGKGSTRYHKNRGCHYLANNLTAVSYEQVSERRNNSGGIYHACAVCGKSAGTGSTVYIMPSGSSYHTSASCSAILAYVRAVRLSEVRHLGPCSYCSR